ncbi:MAG: hypothetical protein NT027_00055 [Proteobacteria bacterium]|nr:hypothetical protein [Pseudomonadota bacterium]
MKIIKSLFQDKLNLMFTTSEGLNVSIIERPKSQLDAEKLTKFIHDLKAVASTSVRHGVLDYGVFDQNSHHLENAVVTLIKDQNGKPIAFNALALMNINIQGQTQDVLHLGLVLVDPNQRSKGISWILYGLTCVILLLRNQVRPIWVSNVTQVPAIIGMVSETFSKVFPTPQSANKGTFLHQSIAHEIMKSYRHIFGVGDDASFDRERFVIKSAYTGGSDNLKKTFGEVAKHRESSYNEMCQRALDYDRGDDFLQIGVIDLKVIIGFLTKTVPKNSILQIGFWLLIALLNSFLLPIYQWFIVDKQFKSLRPR